MLEAFSVEEIVLALLVLDLIMAKKLSAFPHQPYWRHNAHWRSLLAGLSPGIIHFPETFHGLYDRDSTKEYLIRECF